jgi:type II secretory pathway component GspD/PulD (secretin)
VDHGKPGFEKAVVPLPRLRIREVNASNTVRNGNVLALRGPLTEEIIQFKDKVPVLGDIPLLGRLFRKESSQTRRSRLYVFVQPEEVDGSGQKVVRP